MFDKPLTLAALRALAGGAAEGWECLGHREAQLLACFVRELAERSQRWGPGFCLGGEPWQCLGLGCRLGGKPSQKGIGFCLRRFRAYPLLRPVAAARTPLLPRGGNAPFLAAAKTSTGGGGARTRRIGSIPVRPQQMPSQNRPAASCRRWRPQRWRCCLPRWGGLASTGGGQRRRGGRGGEGACLARFGADGGEVALGWRRPAWP